MDIEQTQPEETKLPEKQAYGVSYREGDFVGWWVGSPTGGKIVELPYDLVQRYQAADRELRELFFQIRDHIGGHFKLPCDHCGKEHDFASLAHAFFCHPCEVKLQYRDKIINPQHRITSKESSQNG